MYGENLIDLILQKVEPYVSIAKRELKKRDKELKPFLKNDD